MGAPARRQDYPGFSPFDRLKARAESDPYAMSATADFTQKSKIPTLATEALDRSIAPEDTTRRSNDGQNTRRSVSDIRQRYSQYKASNFMDETSPQNAVVEYSPPTFD